MIVMHRPRLGEGKRAIILAMGQINLLKLVIVVEDDIDPEDPRQVEWSLAARQGPPCAVFDNLRSPGLFRNKAFPVR